MLDHVKLSHHALTRPSPKRFHNEDALIELDRTFCVFDGMGGHSGGEIASHSAATHLKAAFSSNPHTRFPLDQITQRLIDQIQRANTHLWNISLEKPALKGMGTTLLALQFDGRFAIHAHLGDSRLYRLRDQKLDQLTSDHTAYRQELTSGAPLATQKHVLTKALGCSPTVMPTLGYQVVFPRDRFLLCTDGISDFLTPSQIKNFLSLPTPAIACHQLATSAREAGSQDDITAIVIQVEFPDAPTV